ncbi:hypothetical protein BCR33DRAFT_712613 [Rhizoclosmatium globosum]|uniref:Translation initiation factor 3 N-terminal domain-containing protein n=1 Tax=Rhizoclosmatium globosum TaxID=329046 RepID=A0A1Y2CX19_9FUNG|nr:hypothetical protein BCR33DRAFT_712613 [Rhizoclosmatium globosum]|eukprot:ORY51579.1 hypothetical protein BCR33DRAFT_712613 [Rhizoclosmatium globosum]
MLSILRRVPPRLLRTNLFAPSIIPIRLKVTIPPTATAATATTKPGKPQPKTNTQTPASQTNPNGLRNSAIPFTDITLISPGKGQAPQTTTLQAALADLKGTPQDIVLVDASYAPFPLCRVVTTSDTDKLASAAAAAAKLLAAPRNQQVVDAHPTVLVVGVGVKTSKEALAMCRPGEDLVLVGAGAPPKEGEKAKPPACKILNRKDLETAVELGKKAYKSMKGSSEASSTPAPKSHKNEVKDIEIKTGIGANDLGVKVKKMGELLKKGYAVQLKLNDTLKSPKKSAEMLNSIKALLEEAGLQCEVSEVAKGVKKDSPGKEDKEDRFRTRYIIRAK